MPGTRLREDREDKERGLLAAARARSPRRKQAVAPIGWTLREGGGRGSRSGGAALRPDRVAQLVGAPEAATGSRHIALGEARGEQRPRVTRLTSVGAVQATPRSLHSTS